jgi:hypothetical protein
MDNTDHIVAAIRERDLSTRDLVRISYALAERGANTTSVLGQYGEELVAAAYGGGRGSFDQKGYDVTTASGEFLQVKTYTKGRRPGVIRSFGYDVVTVEVDPVTAGVVVARRYLARDLHAVFSAKWASKYRHINANFATWAGGPTDRYERGWTIGSDVPYTDVTDVLVRAASRLGVTHEELATPARSHLPAAPIQAPE